MDLMMLLGHLIVSITVAVAVTGVALAGGWGVLGSVLIYSLSGTLTLLLLALWTALRTDR